MKNVRRVIRSSYTEHYFIKKIKFIFLISQCKNAKGKAEFNGENLCYSGLLT
jgi:hypothetical protein